MALPVEKESGKVVLLHTTDRFDETTNDVLSACEIIKGMYTCFCCSSVPCHAMITFPLSLFFKFKFPSLVMACISCFTVRFLGNLCDNRF